MACPWYCPICGEEGSVINLGGECYCQSCSVML